MKKNIIITESQLMRVHKILTEEISPLDGNDSTKLPSGVCNEVPITDNKGEMSQRKVEPVNGDEYAKTIAYQGYYGGRI